MRAFVLSAFLATAAGGWLGTAAAPMRSAVRPASSAAVMMGVALPDATDTLRRKVQTQSELGALAAESAAAGRLLLVKFYAPWCRQCRNVSPRLDKFIRNSPQHDYAEVNFAAAGPLCRDVGITHLPTMQVYRGGELVLSAQVSYSRFPLFAKEVERLQKELRGEYVPRDTCSYGHYWDCSEATPCDYSLLARSHAGHADAEGRVVPLTSDGTSLGGDARDGFGI